MRKLALHWQILIAIGLAVVVGSWVRSYTTDDFMPNLVLVHGPMRDPERKSEYAV